MRIIHNLETCLLCGYPRRGLEPGRPCPECGVGLFPNAPVFELGISRGWVKVFILLGGVMGVLALIFGGTVPLPTFLPLWWDVSDSSFLARG